MQTVNRYTLPLATYDTLYAVLERMADVIGTPPKRLFGKLTYTVSDNGRTEVISLTKKAISIRVIKDGKVIAKGHTRFPINGVISISYGEPSSAIIVKAYDGLLLLILLSGVSHDAIEYVANGKVTSKPMTPKPDIRKPYSFSIVKDADVPPMESFTDLGKPYPVSQKQKRTVPVSVRHPKGPFCRWNEPILTAAKGKKVEVYTDGGLRPEEGHLGGWAFVVVHNENVAVMEAGTETETTISRMELLAAVKALQALIEVNPFEAVVYTDNRYVQTGAEIWWKGWLNEDGSVKETLKDADLWAELIKERQKLKKMCCNVSFQWVKGHSGVKWNTYVDAKNKEAMDACRK